MIISHHAIAAAFVLAMFVAAPAQAQTALTAVEGATIIDGTGSAPIRDGVILIRGNRIEAVGSRTSITIPADAKRVDARGKFIIPGLIDAHTHYREDWMDELYLLHGVTSVMAEGVQLDWDIAQQEARAKGKIRGPRFYTSGPALRCPNRINCTGPEWQPERVKQRIAALAKAGVTRIAVVQFQPPDVLKAVVEEANKWNIPVAGETYYVREASQFGYGAVTHTYGIAMGAAPPDARAKVIAAVGDAQPTDIIPHAFLVPPASTELHNRLLAAKVALIPMLVTDFKATNDRVAEFIADSEAVLKKPELDYVPTADLAANAATFGPISVPPLGGGIWPLGSGYYGSTDPRGKNDGKYLQYYRNTQAFLRNYAKAGGKILAGTDVGNYVVPGLAVLHEMQLLNDFGLTPMQTLQAATLWPAEFLRKADDIGSLRAGRFADFVILDANPLTNMANVKRVRQVYLNGAAQDMSYHRGYTNPIPLPPVASGPILSSISPSTAVEGSGPLELGVRGMYFNYSVVTVDGTPVPTRNVSEGRLIATLPKAMTDKPGTLEIRVDNPGGYSRRGVSDPASLIVKFK